MQSISDVTEWLENTLSGSNFSGNPHDGIERMRILLEALGNPQKTYKVLHIAGTSGKGTTSRMSSYLLYKAGKKVGLTLSPHILDIRERCMINNEYCTPSIFIHSARLVKSALEQVTFGDHGSMTYFEIMICIALHAFALEKVDYAVLETGLGGRWDATNVINTVDKVCVITSIGYDHVEILGDTLEKIAVEKAMITHDQNHCFTYFQSKTVNQAISDVVEQQGGEMHTIPVESYDIAAYPGAHNDSNISLALAAVQHIASRDGFDLHSVSLKECPPLIGRGSIYKIHGIDVLIDGAHNVQKIEGLLMGLSKRYADQKCTFIIAVKDNKDLQGMLSFVLPHTHKLITTQFSPPGSTSTIHAVPGETLHITAEQVGFTDIISIKEPQKAFEYALSINTGEPIIITGSFYLVAEIAKILETYK